MDLSELQVRPQAEDGARLRRASYRVAKRVDDGKYVDPDAYLATAARHEGSWWPAWQDWLVERSGERVPPPAMGAPEKGFRPLGSAPGTYVLGR